MAWELLNKGYIRDIVLFFYLLQQMEYLTCTFFFNHTGNGEISTIEKVIKDNNFVFEFVNVRSLRFDLKKKIALECFLCGKMDG